MSKLNKVGYHDKETGELLSYDIYKSIESEDFKAKYRLIYDKLENRPLDLTVDEIEIIRKSQNVKHPDKVNLKYSKGYYMTSKDQEILYEELNPLTVWVMSVCNFRSNKYGLLKYKNGTAIKSLSALKKYLEMSDYRWRLVSKDVVKYSLIKEQVHDLNTYLVVNPLYTSSNYEITQYKFMAFHRELREAVLPLEYLYLCKKFEIIP